MITCLIEMLELPNFDHMTTSTIKFESNSQELWRHKLYFKIS